MIDSLISRLVPDVAEIATEIIRNSIKEKEKAQDEKNELLEKLENASGEDLFKYMNLISFANMDEFTANSRLQAQQSFRMCLFCAISGFFIIIISICFAIYFQIAGIEGLSASYLGVFAGIITEFISTIFFVLYTRTTNQVNRLHDRLLGSQSAYSAILSASLIDDQAQRQAHIISMSEKMMSRLEALDKKA